MNIVCVGGGSIGMLMAAKLAAQYEKVVLITHTEQQSSTINNYGLTLQEDDTDTVLHVPARSFEQLTTQGAPQPLNVQPDWILLTVKQKHLTKPLLEAVSNWLGERGKLLCFQNGIGHVETIAEYVPSTSLYLAVTTEAAKKLTSNRIAHTGVGITWIGPAFSVKSCEADNIMQLEADNSQKMMEKSMNEAGFRTFLSNQMNEIVWNKLLINSVINPLTALLRIRNGELPATVQRKQLMRQLLEEGKAVALGNGVQVRDDLWEQLLEVCAKTAANSSSMLQDLAEGRLTEIDWINGAMLERARRHRIPVPLHETIYHLVKAAEPPSTVGR